MNPVRGYYRLLKPLESMEKRVGQLFYFMEMEGNNASILQGENYWTVPYDEFLTAFEFVPNGAEIRQKQAVKLMMATHEIGVSQDQMLITSAVLPSLPSPDQPEEKTGELIVKDDNSPAVMANKVKKFKSSMATQSAIIAKKERALQRIIKEQSLILKQKQDLLKAQMNIASQAIYMINAYLGTDEELVRIKDGPVASADEPIVIRQMILFMDEEIAAAKEWMGRNDFDFEDIAAFDNWLCDPKHLNQVLPEKKGIIALRPRRKNKEYGDIFSNIEYNKLNKSLYLLVRNGDLLYRIYTSLSLDDVLFPRRDEFEKFFYTKDYRGGEWNSFPLYPGDHKYMDAMKAAEAEQRRYYTVLLLVQGILDRTKVLKPLPEERINVCDIHQSVKHFKFLTDCEMILGDGKPSFDDWRREKNEALTVGNRIIGNMQRAYSYSDSGFHNEDRIRPKRATWPDNKQLYTLEAKEGTYFLFRYERKDNVYSGWGDYDGHAPIRRATCLIQPSDTNILNFDAVTVDELNYYINCRLHRHNYQKMLPVLKIALEMKAKEAKTEAPFRKLLIGQIVKTHGVSYEVAEENIDELITWWKYKAKTHRALTSDDGKAIRMIVAEFKNRQAIKDVERQNSASNNSFVERILAKYDDVLAIFAHKNDIFTVYRHENNDNVFATEELWSNELEQSKTSVIVDTRHQSWLLLWQHERWNSWEINAREAEHLTKAESDRLIEYVLSCIGKQEDHEDDDKYKKRIRGAWDLPLCVSHSKNWQGTKDINAYYVHRHASLKHTNLLTEGPKPPIIHCVSISWKKKHGEVTFSSFDDREHGISAHFGDEISLEKLWSHGKVLKIFPDAIEQVNEEIECYKELSDKRQELGKPSWDAAKQVQNKILEAWYTEEHKKFLEEYEDDEECTLWQEHKRKLKKPSNKWPGWFDRAGEYLIERGISLDKMSVKDIVEQAKTFGFELDEDYVVTYESVKDLIIDYSLPVEDESWSSDEEFDED